jgi:GAF domain-containing protein
MSRQNKTWPEIEAACRALLSPEDTLLSSLANLSAELFQDLSVRNWVGFYLIHQGRLVLGPFQGKPACVSIPVGKGVCGTSVLEERTVVVPDVHRFPGHIACDSASRSEIVVPLRFQDRVIGVLDIDSPQEDTFDEEDALHLENVVRDLVSRLDFSRLGEFFA